MFPSPLSHAQSEWTFAHENPVSLLDWISWCMIESQMFHITLAQHKNKNHRNHSRKARLAPPLIWLAIVIPSTHLFTKGNKGKNPSLLYLSTTRQWGQSKAAIKNECQKGRKKGGKCGEWGKIAIEILRQTKRKYHCLDLFVYNSRGKAFSEDWDTSWALLQPVKEQKESQNAAWTALEVFDSNKATSSITDSKGLFLILSSSLSFQT